jgi:hypothetical protein
MMLVCWIIAKWNGKMQKKEKQQHRKIVNCISKMKTRVIWKENQACMFSQLAFFFLLKLLKVRFPFLCDEIFIFRHRLLLISRAKPRWNFLPPESGVFVSAFEDERDFLGKKGNALEKETNDCYQCHFQHSDKKSMYRDDEMISCWCMDFD